MTTWCIVVAAGQGSRFGGDGPKQYELLGGRRVLDHSLEAARAAGAGLDLVAVQTPQGFAAAILRRAHAGGDSATDDAGLVERAGGRVVAVIGEDANRKITAPADLSWAAGRLAGG